MNVVIYLARNKTNGKVYVGQTRQKWERRWYRHVWDASQGSPNRFHDAIRRYGADDFEVSQIATVLQPEWADAVEIQIIADHNSFNYGYNDTKGGGGGKGSKCRLGKTHTPETRAKLSAARKGRPGNRLGCKNSPEHIEKMRQARLGTKLSEETKRKIGEAFRGRSPANKGVPHTEEAKRKMSEAQKNRARRPGITDNAIASWKGRKHSEESKRKMSEARKARPPMPQAQRDALSEIMKAKVYSAETKQRMSEARRLYWARKKGLAA